jgi:hypothetical protein
MTYLNEIFDVCRTDPLGLELAILNLEALTSVMKTYSCSQAYFNSVLEEAEVIESGPVAGVNDTANQEAIQKELEKIFRKKLILQDLVKIGMIVGPLIQRSLGREEKRVRGRILDWFFASWPIIQAKISELRLPDTLFTE